MTDAQEDEAARVDIDQMMDEGLAALENEQYGHAAEVFRQIIQRAPFRHDARDYLAFSIDQQFARETGRTPMKHPGSKTVMSSAAAATSSRARPPGIRFPRWLAAVTVGLTLLVIGVVALASRVDLRDWVQSIGKPSTAPILERIAADLGKADDLVGRRQFDEAVELLTGTLEAAKTLDPPDPRRVERKIAEVRAAEAQLHVSKSNYPKAIAAAKAGLKYDSAEPQLNYTMGFCYFQQGLDAASRNKRTESQKLYGQACAALEKAVAGDADHLRALDYLGKSYIKINNSTKAVEAWKRIIAKDPNSREAKTARDYLRTLGFKNP